MNQGLYRTFLSPAVQQLGNDYTASWLRRLHPHRVGFEVFSDKNPLIAPIATLAERVRAHRRPVAPDNLFLALQETVSRQIVEALDHYRDARDRFCEGLFLWLYGSPLLQAAVGLRAYDATARARVGRDVSREAASAKAMAELEARFGRGGLHEAVMRALLYIGLGNPEQAADERGFAMLRQIREEQPESHRLTLGEFKSMVRAQYLLLRRDEERALSAIPRMLPTDPSERTAALDVIRRVVAASGDDSDETKRRLARVGTMFETRDARASEAEHERWTVASVHNRSTSRQRKGATAAQGSADEIAPKRGRAQVRENTR